MLQLLRPFYSKNVIKTTYMGSGRPVSVDFAINIETDNRLLNCIPIEAKRELHPLSFKQPSYINKPSTCK